MRKNGFTLIELLAVITILSIITLVASISVANMLKESKTELSAAQIESIKESAKSWSSDNMDELPTNNSCSFIILKDLKEDGLLDSSILDPKDRKEIPNNMKIKITSKINGNGNSVLTYEVNSKDVEECSYIGSNIYVDVPEGLTPVIYDGENWKVPEANEKWYNYNKQMWANAVVLGKGKTKKPGEKVSVEGDNPDALMMLVYIPRYEYKIEGEYGTHTDGTEGTQELPGEIEVKFINNSKTTADEDYILHPAFKFGDQEVSGIWVGKFEISHITLSSSRENDNLQCSTVNCTNAEGLRILPSVESLRYNTISNFFYAIKSIENISLFGLSNIDVHMIKNSEWGAVAYLSQSKYGKYGNTDYTDTNKEIYQSKKLSLTGNSNGTPSTDDANKRNPQCSYNDMTKLGEGKGFCGPGASTTGNIYGIYDMNGSSWEYVMAAYGDDKPTIQNTNFSEDSFNNSINKKYYDLYTQKETIEYTSLTACEGQVCYGHGFSEVDNWYNNTIHIPNNTYAWIIKGGCYNDSDEGIFSSKDSTGNHDQNRSTRLIIIY